MTELNEISPDETARARRRGNPALWIATLCGLASIGVLIIVLLGVYNSEKKYAAGRNTIAGLEAEIVQLNEKRRAAQTAAAEAQDREARARDRAKQAEEDAETLFEQAKTRRAELARVSADVNNGRIDLADQQDRVARLKQQQSQLSADIQKQKAQLAADVQQQQEQLTSLRVQAAGASAQVQQLRSEVDTLGESRRELRNLQQQITAQRETLADLAVQESTAREALSGTLAQSRLAAEAQTQRLEELKAVESDLRAMKRQLDARQAQRAEAASAVAELTVSRDRLQNEVAELQETVRIFEAKASQTRNVAEPGVE